MNRTEGGAPGASPSYPPHGALDPTGMLVRSAGSSMDRASDYGSEGWGFDSLPARYQGKRLHRLTHTVGLGGPLGGSVDDVGRGISRSQRPRQGVGSIYPPPFFTSQFLNVSEPFPPLQVS